MKRDRKNGQKFLLALSHKIIPTQIIHTSFRISMYMMQKNTRHKSIISLYSNSFVMHLAVRKWTVLSFSDHVIYFLNRVMFEPLWFKGFFVWTEVLFNNNCFDRKIFVHHVANSSENLLWQIFMKFGIFVFIFRISRSTLLLHLLSREHCYISIRILSYKLKKLFCL